MSESDLDLEFSDKYTLWFHDSIERSFELDTFTKIYTITNIREYFSINNALSSIPKMLLNNLIFIMKNDIKPLWTDEQNINGGCISWKINKEQSLKSWENLFKMFISNEFTELNDYNITGISIAPKKGCNIIKLWFGSEIPQNVLNKIQLSDNCLFKENLKVFKAYKKFL